MIIRSHVEGKSEQLSIVYHEPKPTGQLQHYKFSDQGAYIRILVASYARRIAWPSVGALFDAGQARYNKGSLVLAD